VIDHGRGVASVFSRLRGLQADKSYRHEWPEDAAAP
jgi:hypothetical protein